MGGRIFQTEEITIKKALRKEHIFKIARNLV